MYALLQWPLTCRPVIIGGFIVTYDWSGKYILDERPFAMTLNGVTGGGHFWNVDGR